MDNVAAVKALCNAICNTFHPDTAAVEVLLFNNGLYPLEPATPKDPALFKVAVRLVMGYVEGSRSEGGISTGVRSEEAIRRSIMSWCAEYGLDPGEVIPDNLRVIESASDLW